MSLSEDYLYYLKIFGIDSAFLWRGFVMDPDKMKSKVVLWAGGIKIPRGLSG